MPENEGSPSEAAPAKRNKRNKERNDRKKAFSELKDNYKGELMGMEVFEGEVELPDGRQPEGASRMQVRIILSKEMRLPKHVEEQNIIPGSDVNNNLFASLYFRTQAELVNGLNAIIPGSKNSPQARVALERTVDLYKKNQTEGSEYPLTLVYGHGHVDRDNKHIIFTAEDVGYPIDTFLPNLIEAYPPPKQDMKIPVILNSCNQTNIRIAEISHPQMQIVYKQGISGRLGTGSVVVSG